MNEMIQTILAVGVVAVACWAGITAYRVTEKRMAIKRKNLQLQA